MRPVPLALVATLLTLLTLVAVGCGGGGGGDEVAGSETERPQRSALAERLASLCEKARLDTEALGLPGDKGFAVVPPTAAIGLRLGRAVGRLRGSTPAERARVAELARNITYYFGEMRAGAKLYELGQPEGYVATMERAKPVLVRYEAIARRLGAPECAVRPFPDA